MVEKKVFLNHFVLCHVVYKLRVQLNVWHSHPDVPHVVDQLVESDIVLIDVFTWKHLEAFKFIIQLGFTILFGQLGAFKKPLEYNVSCTDISIETCLVIFIKIIISSRPLRTKNGCPKNGSGPRPAQAVRECSYSEFLKCKPLDFKGTEGVVGLTRWFEKMESVFSISNCTASCQVKFATCTLQDDALTWWNAHVKTTTPEAAHAMPWATLKKMMTDKYCPRGEIKKIETEMWNLKVKGTDVVAYSRRFQQLVLSNQLEK
ncbi:reverse transcriptase domain-containing protein [Tanacetum coccineum]